MMTGNITTKVLKPLQPEYFNRSFLNVSYFCERCLQLFIPTPFQGPSQDQLIKIEVSANSQLHFFWGGGIFLTVLFNFLCYCIYYFFLLDINCFVDKKEAMCMVVFLSVLSLSLLANSVLAYLCEYPYVLNIAACYMHFTFYYYWNAPHIFFFSHVTIYI